MNSRARRSGARASWPGSSTVPAPTIAPGTRFIARIASSAAGVRKVTSSTGRPPSTSASAIGTRVFEPVDHQHRDDRRGGEDPVDVRHGPLPSAPPRPARNAARTSPSDANAAGKTCLRPSRLSSNASSPSGRPAKRLASGSTIAAPAPRRRSASRRRRPAPAGRTAGPRRAPRRSCRAGGRAASATRPRRSGRARGRSPGCGSGRRSRPHRPGGRTATVAQRSAIDLVRRPVASTKPASAGIGHRVGHRLVSARQPEHKRASNGRRSGSAAWPARRRATSPVRVDARRRRDRGRRAAARPRPPRRDRLRALTGIASSKPGRVAHPPAQRVVGRRRDRIDHGVGEADLAGDPAGKLRVEPLREGADGRAELPAVGGHIVAAQRR